MVQKGTDSGLGLLKRKSKSNHMQTNGTKKTHGSRKTPHDGFMI